jgi:hypothetical protein
MDGMTLLSEAWRAGLTVGLEGELLRITGPKSAGPVATKLLANKQAVIAALSGPIDSELISADERPCETCGGLMLWWNLFNERKCMKCQPPTKSMRILALKAEIERRQRK